MTHTIAAVSYPPFRTQRTARLDCSCGHVIEVTPDTKLADPHEELAVLWAAHRGPLGVKRLSPARRAKNREWSGAWSMQEGEG